MLRIQIAFVCQKFGDTKSNTSADDPKFTNILFGMPADGGWAQLVERSVTLRLLLIVSEMSAFGGKVDMPFGGGQMFAYDPKLLKEIVPNVKRVAVLRDPNGVSSSSASAAIITSNFSAG